MDETKVLTEANRLVASGLRHAAIDLLREGLESSPDSAALHGAIGRVYLLEGQPDKAVIHLQRSLEVGQARKVAAQSSPRDQDDDFTDDDLAFVDAQAEQQDEIAIPPYDLVATETRPVDRAVAPAPPPRLPLHNAPQDKGPEAGKADPSEPKVSYRRRRRIQSRRDASTQAHRDEEQPFAEPRPASAVLGLESLPEAKPLAHAPPPRQPTPTPQHSPGSPHDRAAQAQRKADHSAQTNSVPGDSELAEHDCDPDLDVQPPEELSLHEPEVDLDLEESEIDDDGFSDLAEALASIPDLEETDTLSWDDLEDLDEFDELAQREHPDQLPTEDTLTRAMRARQVAVEILLECEWPSSAIDLLQQVFIEDGWGAARVAIERELKKGLVPDELALARVVRGYWSENERFWTTFQRIKTNAPFMQADAAYRHMSWAEALRIVRCFPAIPAAEEVTGLIEETYDWWYNDASLRRSFKIFLKFLKYRTGSMRGALPGHCLFDFLEWPECGPETDSMELLHSMTPGRRYLWELGIQLPLDGEEPPRNIIRISQEQKE